MAGAKSYIQCATHQGTGNAFVTVNTIYRKWNLSIITWRCFFCYKTTVIQNLVFYGSFFSFLSGVRHLYVLCDGCSQEPIVGLRWRCLTCPNFDLCTNCYMTDTHDVEHRFERIDKSRGKGYCIFKGPMLVAVITTHCSSEKRKSFVGMLTHAHD